MVRRPTTVALLVACALLMARTAHAATFYVSPSGSDSAAGGLTSPWRTVSRVNKAAVAPGDVVLFAGGAAFGDTTLMPSRSGSTAAAITFGSYGVGQATLIKGVWLDGTSNVVFDGLTVNGGGAAGSTGIASARGGAGASSVTIRRCQLLNLEVGINMANRGDSGWRVENTLIQHTGDSGVITIGHDSTFASDTILDTGQNSAITYGKHGIYAKGPGLTLVGNTIRRFSANGISLRYRNAVARGNTISDGGIGIAWFQNDTAAGMTTIADNSITGTRSSGIYVSPSDNAGATRESFEITGNSIVGNAGNGMDIERTSGSLVVTGNRLSGAISPALVLKQPGGSLVQRDNLVGAAIPPKPAVAAPAPAPPPVAPAAGAPAAGQSRTLLSGLSPASGSTVGRTFTIHATTADEAVRARFTIDGRTACVDDAAPFVCTVRAAVGVHRVRIVVGSQNGTVATRHALLRVQG